MPTTFLRRCCALVLGFLLLLLLWVALRGTERLDSDITGVTTYERQTAEANRNMARLNDRLIVIRRSAAIKDRIIQDLIAGRLTLFEAAAHYEAVTVMPLAPILGPGASREEQICLLIISEVCSKLARDPDQAARRGSALDDDLRTCLRSNGAVYLPSPDPLYLLQVYQEVPPIGIGDLPWIELRQAEYEGKVSPPQ